LKNHQELWRKEANRRSLPRRGQSLRNRLDRWPPLQANTPKLPVIHTISSYLRGRKFEASFQTVTLSRRGMWAGVAQGGLISPVVFSLYVNEMPSPSQHIDLALYAHDTAIIATSRKPALLVSNLESYLNNLQRRLSEWRITINVSKSTAIIFARAGRRFIQPRPVTLLGEPIEWVDTTRYLGITLDKVQPGRLTSIRLERRLLRGWTSWVPS